MSSADEHDDVGSPAPRRPRSPQVPIGHALLAVVVAALGALLLVQSLTPAPRRVELVDQGTTWVAPHAPADRVASVANALLLRAAFSAIPDLRAASPTATPTRPASVTTGLFGTSGLRPAGLVLPSRTADTPEQAVSGVLWAAYEAAAGRVRESCHLSPGLLAAIGEVESSSLAGRRLDAGHNVVPPVLGPTLSGSGVAAVRDTDDGQWDGDRTWDRAVGPMQFIPGTWRAWGSDGNGDGIANSQNVEDATYSAARYLCAGGRDLAETADLRAAILSYNHSMSYLARVLELMSTIERGSLPRLGVAPAPSTQAPTITTRVTPNAVPSPPADPTTPPAPTVSASPTVSAESRTSVPQTSDPGTAPPSSSATTASATTAAPSPATSSTGALAGASASSATEGTARASDGIQDGSSTATATPTPTD